MTTERAHRNLLIVFMPNRHSAQAWLSGHSAKTSLGHIAAQSGQRLRARRGETRRAPPFDDSVANDCKEIAVPHRSSRRTKRHSRISPEWEWLVHPQRGRSRPLKADIAHTCRDRSAQCQDPAFWLYSRGMNDAVLAELSAWLTQAGLAGTSEIGIVSGFCERCVAAGIPLARALTFVDTLDPVHEGRLLRWGYGPTASPLVEYGRTHLDALAPSNSDFLDVDAAQRWLETPHYRMLQTGDSFLRRRMDVTATDEFPTLADFLAAGMTDYVAIISRFAPEGVIGEMDGVYSSWATRAPDGFSDGHIAALQQLAPYLALAIKSVSLARMTGTLMETYLGRGAGRRVLGGRIVRGIAERIAAVIWFSVLRGFTRITDTAPEQVIPLLNDYFDAIVSAIDGHGGDVVQLVGDGAFAIFPAEDRARGCGAALSAAIAAREGIVELNGAEWRTANR